MIIWRNNQPEEVDFFEFNNWLVSIIDSAAKEFGLISEFIPSEPPKIERNFWTGKNKDKSHFILKEIIESKDQLGGYYVVAYDMELPDGVTRIETASVFYCKRCAEHIRESLFKLARWYHTGEPLFKPPPGQ